MIFFSLSKLKLFSPIWRQSPVDLRGLNGKKLLVPRNIHVACEWQTFNFSSLIAAEGTGSRGVSCE